jgi:trk system potassium uptake protein TrkA
MRAVFIGASSITLMTVHVLLARGHEVVIVERDEARIKELADSLDCGFIHGDGSTPAILKETGPEHTDVLFCLTGNDQANIIAGLVGRSLGFKRVVPKIDNPEFGRICVELGLHDTIEPDRTAGRYLADMFQGRDPLEISAMIRDEARFFSFIASAAEEMTAAALDLPGEARVICIYRDDHFTVADEETVLHEGDEVIILTHSKNLTALQERWPGTTQQKTPLNVRA